MFQRVRPNGEAIQNTRRAQGLTLRVVAQRAGINHAHLWRAEKGIADMSDDKLQRLAGALGEPIENITFPNDQQETP